MEDAPKLIVNLTRANIVCERVELADRPLTRMRGLLGRARLRPGEGVLLQPAPSIHTAFVQFEFDAVFLDMNLSIVRIVERIKPWRIVAARRAASVLQIAAGEAGARGVMVGDQIVVADRVAGRDGLEGLPVRQAAAKPRVLLAAGDRRFRSVAAALLERRGYHVTVTGRVSGLAEEATVAGVDVVVVDAGQHAAAAALEAARLEALHPTVGLVLVSDAVPEELQRTPVVARWGSLDLLVEAIDSVGCRVGV